MIQLTAWSRNGGRSAVLSAAIGLAVALPGTALAGGSVYINEVGYAATGSAGAGTKFEYVELFNPFSVSADITGWTIGDDQIANLFTFPNLVVPAHAFVVVYSSDASGTIAPDSNVIDGSATFVASATWTVSQLGNAGDGVRLADPFGIVDFVYYDEANAGDVVFDAEAVAAGIWKSLAAIDTIAATTHGRAIALKVDGATPNRVNPNADAEDLDWMQYAISPGGTPGTWNEATTIFRDAFETGELDYWSDKVGAV